MRLGAQDYIMKGNLSRLCPATARELEEAKTRSEHKQAESQREAALAALRESEEKYRTILENIEEAYFEDDLSGNLTFVNDIMCSILGYSREELIGMNYRQYTNEKNASKLQELYNRLYKTGKPIKAFDLEAINKNGIKMIYETSAFLMRNPKGNPIGFRGVAKNVTERKRAEEELRQSEEKYRNILENMQEGYFELDLAGNFTFLNDAECKNLGYSREELIGMNNRQYQNEATAKKTHQLFSNLYKTGEAVKATDVEIIRKNGTTGFNEISVSLIRDAGGKPIGFRGISRDITERKQMESQREAALEALRESEKKYRELYDFLPIPVYEMDLETNITSVNRAIYETFRGTEEDLKNGFKAWQLLSPEEVEKSAKNIARLLNGEQIEGNEYTLKRLDGSVFPAIVISSVIYSNDKPVGLRGAVVDITERKKAEQALQESEERYRALFDRSLDLVYITDFEGRFIDANTAALNRLGYTREEIHTLNFASLLSEDQLPLAIKIVQEMQETGIQMQLVEFRLRHKNGSNVYVETQGSTIISNGIPIAIQAIARDITERKKAEKELKETLNNLQKSIRTTIQVLGTAAETRDPYTAGHQKRVADLACAIATEMGLPLNIIEGIHLAGTIHDIGKISIPSEILTKPAKLTALEFSLVQSHVQHGYEIIKDVESPWPLANIVRQHHERVDGSGYPQGLKGTDILLEARILAIADVVEAMSSHRPYRPALGIDLALEEISGNKGTLYDADAVDACLKLFREKGYTLIVKA
jgi:PAS domain S-box-containing protein